MMIHKENPSDIGAITDITKAAFTNHPHSHNTEHLIVIALRAANALTISLVAEVDGERVGHIAFSPVTFTDGSENWYGLDPISVLPSYQKRSTWAWSLRHRQQHCLKAAMSVMPSQLQTMALTSPPVCR